MGEQVLAVSSADGLDRQVANVWEVRMVGESPRAFNAFCLFRSMGYRRSIKGCLEFHNIEAKKYGSWSRWARLFDWNGRAAAYDEYVAKRTEQEIIAERVERKKRQMEMLNGFDELVQKRIKTLDPDSLDADGAMDLLERSAKLDCMISGSDKEQKSVQGELQINFVDNFKGV